MEGNVRGRWSIQDESRLEAVGIWALEGGKRGEIGGKHGGDQSIVTDSAASVPSTLYFTKYFAVYSSGRTGACTSYEVNDELF